MLGANDGRLQLLSKILHKTAKGNTNLSAKYLFVAPIIRQHGSLKDRLLLLWEAAAELVESK